MPLCRCRAGSMGDAALSDAQNGVIGMTHGRLVRLYGFENYHASVLFSILKNSFASHELGQYSFDAAGPMLCVVSRIKGNKLESLYYLFSTAQNLTMSVSFRLKEIGSHV
jgi:hypothetical protein